MTESAASLVQFSARQVGLRSFPEMFAPLEPVGTHVMGVTVHAWLAGLPLRVWGPSWLEGGTMSLRFRRHLDVGAPLTLSTQMVDGTLHIGLSGAGAVTVADGIADRAGCGQHPTPDSFPLDGAPPDMPLPPQPDALSGRILGSIRLGFDRSAVGPDPEALDADDPWRQLPYAHPAWLSTVVNGLIRASIAFPGRRWTHAGTSIRSIAPIPDGAAVQVTARVDRLFDSPRYRFADIAALVRSDGAPALTAMLTIVYAPFEG